MTPLRTNLLLIGVSICLPGMAQTQDDGETEPLFASNDIIDVTITAPFAEIMRERFYDEDSPGTISYQDVEAGEVTLDIGVRTRGRFRRQAKICPFAPLRLNFKKSETKGTLFAGSNKLKLVTHCRDRYSKYEQALLREYLAYRIFNLMTDASFRVRLMRVKYIDSGEKNREQETFAFLIEHDKQLAKRIGLDQNEIEATEIGYLDRAHTNLASVFQYLIGNTDFSPIRAAEGLPCCHNYVLFGQEEGHIFSIPYDFDMTGLVDAPHTAPNPRFRLRDARERLYRGRCSNNSYLDGTLQAFLERKQAIYDLFVTNPHFDKRSRKRTQQFFDAFYKTISNPKDVQRNLVKRCIG
jgi:hypothetical protein